MRIYVLDTGVMTDHTDFGGRTLVGWGARNLDYGAAWQLAADGYVERSMCWNSGAGDHGTHCASTAAGSRYGVAKKATVVPVMVLECISNSMQGYLSWILAGMDWVVTHDAAHRAAPTGAEPPGCCGRFHVLGGYGTSLAALYTPAVASSPPLVSRDRRGGNNRDTRDFSPANVEGVHCRRPRPFLPRHAIDAGRRGLASNYGADDIRPGDDILSATYRAHRPR